jgi:hypothetical protein
LYLTSVFDKSSGIKATKLLNPKHFNKYLGKKDIGKNSLRHKIGKNIKGFLSIFGRFLPFRWRCRVYSIFSEPPYYDKIALREGTQKIKEHYIENLKIALKNVAWLVEQLDGKIIITSDHGEALGENGLWGHAPKKDLPVLKTVPWFEVYTVKKKVNKVKKLINKIKL